MKISLSKKDFEEILSSYNLGRYLKSKYIFTPGNTIYKIYTTKGEYILKIYKDTNIKIVRYQIKLIDFLTKHKVTTPRIIQTKNGEEILSWNTEKLAIQEFAEGKGVNSANKEIAKDMGHKWGILAKALNEFKDKLKTKNKDHQFKLVKWKKPVLFNQNWEKESEKLLKEIKKIDKTKLKRGLTHGDLCEGNFLVSKNKVSAIIDWDNLQEDYLIQDIAVTIAHILITKKKVEKELIKIFLKEYQKSIKLNSEEKKALYYFIRCRKLGANSWCYDQTLKHPDKKDELMRWINWGVNQYNTFNKISLKDWLEIIE